MENQLRIRTSVRSGSLNLPGLVRIYLVWATGLGLFYLASPLIGYLIFWDLLPKVSLTLLLSVLLIPTLMIRLLFLISGQFPFASKGLLVSFVLLSWVSVLQILWYPIISAQIGQVDVLSTIALALIVPWVLWLGGEALAFVLAQGLHWKQIVTVAYLCLVCAVGYGIIKGFSIYGFITLALQKPFSGEFYNYYIPLSDSLAITGLLLMGSDRRNRLYWQLVIYSLTTILLLFTFSRPSFILFLIVGSVMFGMRSYVGYRRVLLGGLLVTVTAVLLVRALIANLNDIDYFRGAYYSLERIESIFLGTDLSFQRRIELLEEGFQQIRQNWLLGHFMSEAVELGKGTYIHNWLSFWVSYGLGPFFLSIWFIITHLIKGWQTRRNSFLSVTAFCLLLFGFLAILSARSYVWPYIWFTVGFAGAALSSRVYFSVGKVMHRGNL